MKVFIDGEYVDEKDAKISVWDHGLLYGDGIFEGIRVYAGKVFKMKEHMNRLYDSAAAIGLTIPYSSDEMASIVDEAAAMNIHEEGYIRLLVTRGKGSLGLDPSSCPKASVVVIASGIQLYPEELYKKGIAIVTAATRRFAPDQYETRVKTLNYLNNIMAKMEASRAGCREAVMLNAQGQLCECTADNIFLIKDGNVKTPASWCGILEGITRGTIIELAHANKIPLEETVLTRFDLYTADECFMTGSGAEIMPVIDADGRKIGKGVPGPVTAHLRELFEAEVRK